MEAIRDLTRAGFPMVVVSNQSGVGQGLYPLDALEAITRRMVEAVTHAGGALADVLYCLHRPDEGCPCRKPARGLIDQACRTHPIDLPRSFVVGDDPKDITLGRAVGCRTVLVLSGRTPATAVPQWPDAPDHVCRDLREAAGWILARQAAR